MKSIRQQLTRKLLLGFALLLGLGGLGIYFATRAALLREFDDALRSKAQAITTLTRDNGGEIEVDFSDRFMRGFDEDVATDFFQMWDTNGSIVERSESLEGSSLPRRFGTFKEPAFWDLKLPSGFAGRAVGFTFAPQVGEDEDEKSSTSTVVLVVASDRRELDRMLAALALALGASGLFLLAMTALTVPPVLRRELAPLDQLAEQASRITADSLATRFPTDALPGELTPISGRLNDLLARLEESFERERRFSADLAHELRTPIAELRSLAELALKWPDARDARADRETLAIAVQMEGIVTRLLAMLRSERGQLSVTPERIRLAPLLESIWWPFSEKAAERKLEISRDVPDGAEIESDPVLLRSILTNLFDNAVEYTPSGGKIQVRGGVRDGRFTLQVANDAGQVAPADVPKLFGRFWRKDPARSGNERSGLGLPLSRAFAQALGCDLSAALDDESRLTLTLSGPVTASRK